MERQRLVEAAASSGVRSQREAPHVEPRENIALPFAHGLARLAPAVGEEAEPALRRERRVDLPQAARGGVARIDERLLALSLPFPVQRREISEADVDLAPDLQPLRHVLAPERVRQVAHSAQVGGHVLAGLAVASGRAEHQLALAVVHGCREAVDLGLAVELHRLVFGQIEETPDPPLELGEVVVVKSVAERQHGAAVADLGEARCGWRADALARAVGALQVGKARLDGLVAPPQRVVLGIAQRRLGFDVVEPVVMLDLPRQPLELALRGVRREFLRRCRLVAHALARDSRLSAAARASSVTRAPESMRAISSCRCASLNSATRAVAPRSPSLLVTR